MTTAHPAFSKLLPYHEFYGFSNIYSYVALWSWKIDCHTFVLLHKGTHKALQNSEHPSDLWDMVPSEAANILVEYPPRFDASTVKKFRTGRDGAKSCLISTFPLQSCWDTSRSWMTGSILSLFRVHACGQFGSTTLSLTYLRLSRVWAFFQTDRIQIIRVSGWRADLSPSKGVFYGEWLPTWSENWGFWITQVNPYTVIFISQVVPGCSIAMWLGMELLSSSASSMRHLLTTLPNSWGHTMTHRLPWFLKSTTSMQHPFGGCGVFTYIYYVFVSIFTSLYMGKMSHSTPILGLSWPVGPA